MAFCDPPEESHQRQARSAIDGPRRRSMFRDVRNAQDRRFIEAGALYHVKPLSRKEYQAAARGDPWVYPKPRRSFSDMSRKSFLTSTRPLRVLGEVRHRRGKTSRREAQP